MRFVVDAATYKEYKRRISDFHVVNEDTKKGWLATLKGAYSMRADRPLFARKQLFYVIHAVEHWERSERVYRESRKLPTVSAKTFSLRINRELIKHYLVSIKHETVWKDSVKVRYAAMLKKAYRERDRATAFDVICSVEVWDTLSMESLLNEEQKKSK